jgi:hypothetical protein
MSEQVKIRREQMRREQECWDALHNITANNDDVKVAELIADYSLANHPPNQFGNYHLSIIHDRDQDGSTGIERTSSVSLPRT